MASMATKRDYYEVLGIERSASEKDIATSYRRLAIKYHPDSNPNDEEATERFKEAAEAYEVLSDPEKRSRYDQYGHAGVEGAAHFNSVDDIFDAFSDLFGGGGGLFGNMFGGGRRRRQRRGADVRCDVTLTLEEAAKGVKKSVSFKRSKKCDKCEGKGSQPGSHLEACRRCGGHGQVAQSMGFVRVQTTCPSCQGTGTIIANPCDSCGGNGFVSDRASLEVAIPAGIDDGMRLRVSGEGEPSPEGGPPGDCYCFIQVRPHKLFEREGSNLILRLPISYTQAALGATIEVPTLDGRHELDIPKGTQSGEVFRKSGLGLQDPTGGRKGDLLIQTYIETPKKLSAQQEKLLRELAELEHVDVSPHRKSFLEKIRDYFSLENEESEVEK